MKINIQRRIVPFVCALAVLAFSVFGASAVVLDPYDIATSISVDGNADRLYIELPKDDMYWFILNESTSAEKEAYGSRITFSTPMKYFDNLSAEVFPLAFDVISLDGVTSDSFFDFNYTLTVTGKNTTQPFSFKVKLYALFFSPGNAGGRYNHNFAKVIYESSAVSIPSNSFRTVVIDPSIPYDDFVPSASYSSFSILLTIDFSGVDDESDNSMCTLELSGSSSISMSISSLYHQVQETGKGNELLGSVNDKLEENGQKLDDIISGSQEDQEKGEQFEEDMNNKGDDIQSDSDKLDELTPSAPSIDTDLGLDDELLASVASVINLFWAIKGFEHHMFVVVLVATVAYIFFGKRDA